MARALWKGAIVFGLVHVPVDLYPGSKDNTLDFDWIDKRDMAPVGYQRINKTTGKPLEMSQIVKGYALAKGHYVVLTDEDFKAANVKATQTVEILAFVDAGAISPQFFEKPYRLVPGKRGEKGYVLLRETLKRTGKVGIAQVVIRNRQHLAALMPLGDLLELITVRYADEVLGADKLTLPSDKLKAVGISEREVDLAKRLVEDMTEDWQPERYHDTYREDLMKRVKALATKGRTRLVKTPTSEGGGGGGAQIIDLMAALKRSLEKKGGNEPERRAKDDRKRNDERNNERNNEPAARKAPRAVADKKRSIRSVKTATRKRA